MLELRISEIQDIKDPQSFYLPLLKEAGFDTDEEIYSYEDMWTGEVVFQQGDSEC